jgi:hypothetical protein
MTDTDNLRECWYPNPDQEGKHPYLRGWFHTWGYAYEVINEPTDDLRGVVQYSVGLVEDEVTRQVMPLLPEFIFFRKPIIKKEKNNEQDVHRT